MIVTAPVSDYIDQLRSTPDRVLAEMERQAGQDRIPIVVPATGQLMVGGWKPQSISRLAMSSTVTPALLAKGRTSMMHSCATRPFAPT